MVYCVKGIDLCVQKYTIFIILDVSRVTTLQMTSKLQHRTNVKATRVNKLTEKKTANTLIIIILYSNTILSTPHSSKVKDTKTKQFISHRIRRRKKQFYASNSRQVTTGGPVRYLQFNLHPIVRSSGRPSRSMYPIVTERKAGSTDNIQGREEDGVFFDTDIKG